jgi:hypothetical protein
LLLDRSADSSIARYFGLLSYEPERVVDPCEITQTPHVGFDILGFAIAVKLIRSIKTTVLGFRNGFPRNAQQQDQRYQQASHRTNLQPSI